MILRKLLVGAAVAGALSVGAAGAAGAQTAPLSTPSAPGAGTTATAGHINCSKAEATLARLHKRDEAVNDRLAKLEARVQQLRQNGHTKRADLLQQRIDTVKSRLSTVEARLAKVEARVDQKCGVSPDAGSGTGPSTTLPLGS